MHESAKAANATPPPAGEALGAESGTVAHPLSVGRGPGPRRSGAQRLQQRRPPARQSPSGEAEDRVGHVHDLF